MSLKYFTNAELSRKHNVSDKAVRNWIAATEQKKLTLELCTEGGKTYIADTVDNERILETLAIKGRKFRNSKSHKLVRPSGRFYSTYNTRQLSDIISSLETYREFPFRLLYCGIAGQRWDEYLHKLNDAGSNNLLLNTKSSLSMSKEYWTFLLSEYDFVNVVDVYVGNGLASKDLLLQLRELGKLNRYLAIDSSEELLAITKANIEKWFGGKIVPETYNLDLSYENFRDALTYPPKPSVQGKVLNLVLLLGGTIMNFREPDIVLQNIRLGMRGTDLLMTSLKLDSPRARRFFDFSLPTDSHELPLHNRNAFELLGIDTSLYKVEQRYDDKEKARLISIILNVNLSLAFNVGGTERVIDFAKGERILVLRIRHYSDAAMLNMLKYNNYSLLLALRSKDEEYLTTISRAEPKIWFPSS